MAKRENSSYGKNRKYVYNHFFKTIKFKVMKATSYQLKSFIVLTKTLHKKTSIPAIITCQTTILKINFKN